MNAAGSGIGDQLSGVGQRALRQGRAAPVAFVAFAVGVLFAAILIPHHDGTGTASGSSNLASGPSASGPSAGTASGGLAAGGSTGTVGSGGAGLSGGSAGSSGGSAASAAGGTAAAGTGGAGSTGTAGATTGAATSPGAGTKTASTANGGATATGVTATSITVGVLGGDSGALAPACPRCGQGGQQTDRDLLAGLLAAWHKEGKLPVNGRDIKPVFQEASDIDQASATSACEALVGDRPFVAFTAAGTEYADPCLAQRYHIITLDAAAAETTALQQNAPYLWTSGPNAETYMNSFVDWANQNGLLKGHTLGLYSPADASGVDTQEMLSRSFRAEIKKLGYHLAVDYSYQGTGQADDSVAVQRMRTANVDVLFVFGTFTEPSGFQNQAQQLGYRPKYPIADLGYAFTDAVADVEYNSTAEDGNKLFGSKWWNWAGRKPATPADNQAATDCLRYYEDQTHTSLDVYQDDARIRYIFDECTDLDVILKALQIAGPDLTQASFVHALQQIQNLETPEYHSVSFSPTRMWGSNDWQAAVFSKNRFQPSNDYIKMVGPYTPWF